MTSTYKRTLCIPDAHADPDFPDLSRFTALGNYIVETQPDNIVQIGDWGSYDSISSYTMKVPRQREGKRLVDDLKIAREAYELMMTPLWELNKKQRTNKVKLYTPTGFWLEANHEDRVARYIDDNPVLEGFIEETDLVGAAKDGWHIVPWKHYCYIDGVGFTHIPLNDGNGQPISGKYVARRAADSHLSTVVFGHTHRWLIESVAITGESGPHYIEGINIGCYLDYTPGYIQGHAGTTNWWSGLTELTHYGYGKVDVSRISIERVKELYL